MEERSVLNVNQVLHEALTETIEAYPDREALVVGSERLIYRELGERVDRMAAALSGLGIGQGDRVATILPNCPEAFLAFFAASRIGAVAVPINMRLTPRELQHILSDAQAAAIITIAEMMGRPYHPMVQSLWPQLPKLRHLIVKGAQPGEGIVSLEAAMASADPRAIPQVRVAPDDVAAIFYTSGTTGVPKGAMHTHRGALSMCDALLRARGREQVESMLAPYPLFHIGAMVLVLPFFIGGKLVVLPLFDPRAILDAIEAERVACFAAVPVVFYALLRVPGFDSYDLSALKLVGGGGAAFSPDLIRSIDARFGEGLFWQGYGLTEAMWISAATFDDADEKRLYTVGRPSLVQAAVKIVDEERREVPLGEVGEVACRTTGMMKGYYGRPEATAEMIDEEGWLYTGDLGTLDEQGYLKLVDRKKDMIKRGAEAVFPAEIENYLLTHPKIQMAAVIGVPDAIGGELIRAYVQPWEGAELTEAKVLRYCRGQIATFKIPQEVRIVDSLPLTATRKVQKFKLREEARRELATSSGGES
jgi:acyl-CoA synthetase (AMP-forming)/AMP-acid ligase II